MWLDAGHVVVGIMNWGVITGSSRDDWMCVFFRFVQDFSPKDHYRTYLDRLDLPKTRHDSSKRKKQCNAGPP